MEQQYYGDQPYYYGDTDYYTFDDNYHRRNTPYYSPFPSLDHNYPRNSFDNCPRRNTPQFSPFQSLDDDNYRRNTPQYTTPAMRRPVMPAGIIHIPRPACLYPSFRRAVPVPVYDYGPGYFYAVQIQKAFRGYRIRKNVKDIMEIKSDIDALETEFLKGENFEVIKHDERVRLTVNEQLMALLFKLDSIKVIDDAVRICRKSVVRKAILLQEIVDSLAVAVAVDDEEIGDEDDQTLEQFADQLERDDSRYGIDVVWEDFDNVIEIQVKEEPVVNELNSTQEFADQLERGDSRYETGVYLDDYASTMQQQVEEVSESTHEFADQLERDDSRYETGVYSEDINNVIEIQVKEEPVVNELNSTREIAHQLERDNSRYETGVYLEDNDNVIEIQVKEEPVVNELNSTREIAHQLERDNSRYEIDVVWVDIDNVIEIQVQEEPVVNELNSTHEIGDQLERDELCDCCDNGEEETLCDCCDNGKEIAEDSTGNLEDNAAAVGAETMMVKETQVENYPEKAEDDSDSDSEGEAWECVSEEDGEDVGCPTEKPQVSGDVKTTHVNDEWFVIDESNKRNRLLEKMVEDNQKLMKMVADLCQKNETQTELIGSLSQRVEQLEQAVSDQLRRQKLIKE
ncbi:hypothetical protein RND81_11G002500 [Saponaria officinalis]|uniref:BAG domain-containing protein n=1 Tax=Saponaria officinalis TaxID=3572 RepID=A0AAW1HGG0_SAPOF